MRRRGASGDFSAAVATMALGRHSPLALLLVIVLGALTAAIIGWAAFARIDQAVLAPGLVRPTAQVRIVNHPDGGRVSAIHVSEGEAVVAGAPLATLDGVGLDVALDEGRARLAALGAEIARLKAEAAGTQPTFPQALRTAHSDAVVLQERLFAARHEALAARRSAAERVIERRDAEAGALATELSHVEQSLVILGEQEAAVAGLADKGYFPRLRHLTLRRQLSELEGKRAEIQDRLLAAFAALAEARSRLDEIDTEAQSTALAAIAQREAERAGLAAELRQGDHRRHAMVLRAPIAGRVQDLAIQSPGQSLRPNETLLAIVPTDRAVIVRARVADADIAHIAPGQAARVKIEAYDFVRYGALAGAVARIAADAEIDADTGRAVYTVEVRLDDAARLSLLPGMTARVEFHIGRRSVLAYLTERLLHHTADAFKEG